MSEPVLYSRSGSCNLCGECCGAGDGSVYGPPLRGHQHLNNLYDADNPWHIRAFPSVFQGAESNYGAVALPGMVVHWAWIPDIGLCTDLEPYGEPPYSPQCPLLMPDPGDGTRPCVLYGKYGAYLPALGMTLGEAWDTY